VQPAAPAKPAGTPLDVATIMGIPEAELTPKVRAAMGKLMAEVHSLREDLNQARKRIDYLERLADRDALAPVLNRRAFVRELTRAMAFTERYGAPGSVLYFDVNGMKQINDSQGHAAGDAVLKRMAEILLSGVRASDVVGRLGGDEFGVILSQAGTDAAAAKAAVLAQAVSANPIDWADKPLPIAASYGVYSFAGGEAADDALNAADRAMYTQKHGSGSEPPQA
jgi:diguanylate cyclase (GGDEF)-like protein